MINRQKVLLTLYTKWVFAVLVLSQLFFDYTIISQVAIVLMCIMTVLVCITEKRFCFSVYFIFALLFIIQSYIFSVYGISINSETSLAMTKTLVINFIMALAIYNYVVIYDNLEESLDVFAAMSVILTIFIMILSFQSILSVRLGSNVGFTVLGKPVSFSPNSIALIAGFAYLIYLYKYNNTKNQTTLVAMFWLILVVLLTGSKKGILLVVLGTPLMNFLLGSDKKFKNIIISLIVVFGLYQIIINVPMFYDIMGQRVESLVGMVMGGETGDASSNSRSSYIELGWDYFLLRPWTGFGLDNFRYLPDAYRTYSHNNYIELLFSGGIPALFFFYGFRVYMLIKLFINRNLNKINGFLFVSLLIMMVMEYAFVSYFDRIFIILFILILSGYELNKKPNISTEIDYPHVVKEIIY
ncbi:O-antigen ligase family protein [Acetobacterium bakii]|uniref:O-antigen ligase-related domain-containing protein n=1 Tax=Acetobacterium bakii TaxID=52689 RepID=A0A0L6U0K2_9FIRM|nr:O-antigen ligase family protein [Acetobacterium bakii]KNZ42033.1 hypothetical protein AKG39_08840 [Acetobacterium bakii]